MEAAERGSAQHLVLEKLLKGGLPDESLSEDELIGVEWAVDWLKQNAMGGELLTETPVSYYQDDDFDALYTGTADVILLVNGKATTLYDYKSGLDHEYYPQMAAYALAVMQRWKIQTLEAYILYGKTKTTQEFTFEFKETEKYVLETIALRNVSDKRPSPCSYCSWCRHAATCPALAEQANAISVGRDDWKLEQYHASEIASPVQMSKALKLAKFMKAWCEAVEHAAKDMALKQGEAIPGFKLMNRRGAREITSPAKAFELSGLTQAKFLSCCTAKITLLEKLMGKKKFAETMNETIKFKPDQNFLVAEKEETQDAEGDISGS